MQTREAHESPSLLSTIAVLVPVRSKLTQGHKLRVLAFFEEARTSALFISAARPSLHIASWRVQLTIGAVSHWPLERLPCSMVRSHRDRRHFHDRGCLVSAEVRPSFSCATLGRKVRHSQR